MARIALNFEDGVTRIIESKSGETVSDAATAARIKIPLDCTGGICGTCKCKIKTGTCDLGEYEADALSDEEIAEGFGLACQMLPKSDMIIEILASAEACKVEVEKYTAEIVAIEFLSPEIVKLVLKAQHNHKFHFLPGQYAHIEMPTVGITRSYSFSNISDTETVEFLVRLLPEGVMSDYLRKEAKVGSVLHLSGPFGSFYLRDLERPVLFFAGGTGIAPFLSMLEKLSKDNKKHQQMQLFYGATTDENLVELDRLEDFKTSLPFEYSTCVSGEKSNLHPNGFVTQWINKEHLGAQTYDIYVCGPPAMVDAVKSAIEKEGISQNHFYVEKFTPSSS